MNILTALLAVLLPFPQMYSAGEGTLTVHTADWQKVCATAQVTFVDSVEAAGRHQDEAYTLEVSKGGIKVSAVTETGRIRAFQTLRQLSTTKRRKTLVECCSITDWASFSIRGFLQDVGRSYVPLDELKKEVDALAQFKVNVFHWHFTENQAWRLESKKYPELNAAKNMTRHEGLYYTQDEVRDMIAFCAGRGVQVIPEIDMPGHSAAFERTFGCTMQSEKGKVILKDLIDEASEVFRGCKWFHIGTDEVHFTDPGFVPEMVAYVRAHGFKVISYNPGWHYEPGQIDMTHLWSFRGTAQPGIPAIDSKLHYVNHFDCFDDIRMLYGFKPCGKLDGDEDSAGLIIAVWNDRRIDDPDLIVAENSLYPAGLAMAERGWRGGEPGDYWDFERRMLGCKDRYFDGLPFPYVRQEGEKWGITTPFDNGGDLGRVFPPETSDPALYGAGIAEGAGIYLRHVWGTDDMSWFKGAKPNSTAYAWTYIYSLKRQKVGLMVEFQNYSRSEKDIPPRQGTWDYKGSRAWLDGEEILPPVWESQHTEPSNETLLTNENAAARPPIEATLQKGWNKVLLKLPVGEFRTDEVRLVKWMFTFAVVTPDGRHAVDGLVYDPTIPYCQ